MKPITLKKIMKMIKLYQKIKPYLINKNSKNFKISKLKLIMNS